MLALDSRISYCYKKEMNADLLENNGVLTLQYNSCPRIVSNTTTFSKVLFSSLIPETKLVGKPEGFSMVLLAQFPAFQSPPTCQDS